MARIAFIQSETVSFGVEHLSSYLKHHGHEVLLLFDPNLGDRIPSRIFPLLKRINADEENIEKLKEFAPDLIGFSVVTSHYQWALRVSRKIKGAMPSVPIIFGGVHPTLVPDEVIKEDSVDMICLGQGEEALLELANTLGEERANFTIRNIWFKENGKIYRNDLRRLNSDIDKYPFMDKGIFLEHIPRSDVQKQLLYPTSRGCPFRCTFCCNEQMWKIYIGKGKWLRQLSPKRAVEELIFLKSEIRMKSIFFVDDVFTISTGWLEEFVPEYIKHIGLPFGCYSHVNLLDERKIELLKKGGCFQIRLGIQSASESMRKNILKRPEKTADIIRVVKLIKKTDMQFTVDHILNLPYDTHGNIIEAVKLYTTIRPSIINCYRLVYFPKATIIEHALKAGILAEGDISLINEGKGDNLIGSTIFRRQPDFFSKYALILCSIPLLPSFVVNFLVKSQKLLGLFSRLPLFLLPVVNAMISWKNGLGFYLTDVTRRELFHISKIVNLKLKKRFKKSKGYLSWKK